MAFLNPLLFLCKFEQIAQFLFRISNILIEYLLRRNVNTKLDNFVANACAKSVFPRGSGFPLWKNIKCECKKKLVATISKNMQNLAHIDREPRLAQDLRFF